MGDPNYDILNVDRIGDDIQVSIYCLAYNHEKFISTAIESFLMQETSFRYMIYIHDDASTDGTPDIIREYANRYPDKIVAVLQKENQHSKGVKIVRTILEPLFRGSYVAACEGDDYWTDKTKLQQQFAYMEQHVDCPLVAHETVRVSETGEYISAFSTHRFTGDNCHLDVTQTLIHLNDFHTSSLFFRREYYTRNRAFLQTIGSYDYVMKTVMATDLPGAVYVIPLQMSAYRVATTGSWTRRIQDVPEKHLQHLRQSIDALEKIDKYRGYTFHGEFQEEITRRRFRMDVLLSNREAWSNPDYRVILRNMTPKEYWITWMRLFLPGMFRVALRTKGAIRELVRKIQGSKN